MPLPELIIHIGPPKTATTTLQSHVFRKQKDCTFLGKYDPDLITPSKLYNALSKYVVFGRGDLESLKAELKETVRGSKRPILISNENFTKGTFAPGGVLVETKLNRLKALTQGFNAMILLTLRPMNTAAFSARIQFNRLFKQFNPPLQEAICESDFMRVYRYDEFRPLLEALWPEQVFPIEYADIQHGRFEFPGIDWHFSPKIQARKTPRVSGGALAVSSLKRPFNRLARIACHFSTSLARFIHNIALIKHEFVPDWTDAEREGLSETFQRSERAREEWIADTRDLIWHDGKLKRISS